MKPTSVNLKKVIDMPLPKGLVESNFPELPPDFVERMRRKYKHVQRISLATLVSEYKTYKRENKREEQ